jgi:hypothetical protein
MYYRIASFVWASIYCGQIVVSGTFLCFAPRLLVIKERSFSTYAFIIGSIADARFIFLLPSANQTIRLKIECGHKQLQFTSKNKNQEEEIIKEIISHLPNNYLCMFWCLIRLLRAVVGVSYSGCLLFSYLPHSFCWFFQKWKLYKRNNKPLWMYVLDP